MSNQMNVHFINQEKMLAAKVGDTFSGDSYDTSLLVNVCFANRPVQHHLTRDGRGLVRPPFALTRALRSRYKP